MIIQIVSPTDVNTTLLYDGSYWINFTGFEAGSRFKDYEKNEIEVSEISQGSFTENQQIVIEDLLNIITDGDDNVYYKIKYSEQRIFTLPNRI